ncbi:YHYH domain-containing protein [Paenibacillus pinisoli]|uniref:YHYH domain-containing protein n=2 Tax=Paenibacillus pinisoli TaxID=1276110 RepID=A0A3A6PQ85_9BACL|nr:YHYH domain-containing protein [Paenibacillus pinisoli]
MKKTTALIAILLFLCSSLAAAHPGRTDSNGGHTCRTNCEKWGLEYGEYHYHNGGGKSKSSSSSSSSSSKAADTRSAAEIEADGYIWNGDYYLKQGSYYNALYYYFQTQDTGYSWKVNASNQSAAAKKVAEQAKAFYESDQLDKAKLYYELLGQDASYSKTYNVPANLGLIQERQAFLSAFANARWYYNQKNYVNAVLIADKKMKEGLAANKHAVQFMKDAALKLSQQAYSAYVEKDYANALKRYNVIANAEYAPADLKEGARKNALIAERQMKE